jgi:hypothetical protein
MLRARFSSGKTVNPNIRKICFQQAGNGISISRIFRNSKKALAATTVNVKMVDCRLQGSRCLQPRDGLVWLEVLDVFLHSDTKLYYDIFLPGTCHSAVMDLNPLLYDPHTIFAGQVLFIGLVDNTYSDNSN